MAGSRLLLQESIHDEFVERLIAISSKAKLGDPSLPGVAGRAGRDQAAVRQGHGVHRHCARQRARVACSAATRARGEGFGAGQFVEPTIFVDVTTSMRIAQEEVFGPVLSVIKFKDEEDAIRIANDIRFGLASGVWTQSLHRAMFMSERLQGRHRVGEQLPLDEFHDAVRRLQA